jgi:ankyrin repeat protein
MADPFFSAARSGNLNLLEAELRFGALIDARDESCSTKPTALILAAKHGHAHCLLLLIASGADVEAKDSHGWTSLMMVTLYGHEACLRSLIKSGAHIEAKDYLHDESTPAMLAAMYGHESCLTLLVQAGANLSSKDLFGQTVAQKTRLAGSDALASWLTALALAQTELNSLRQVVAPIFSPAPPNTGRPRA